MVLKAKKRWRFQCWSLNVNVTLKWAKQKAEEAKKVADEMMEKAAEEMIAVLNIYKTSIANQSGTNSCNIIILCEYLPHCFEHCSLT